MAFGKRLASCSTAPFACSKITLKRMAGMSGVMLEQRRMPLPCYYAPLA
jgi:hypothetical protein